MTVKEIWNSCLCTTLTVSTIIFLWVVGSSVKNIAGTFNKWDPKNIETHAKNLVDHAADRVDLSVIRAVDTATIKINEIVDHATEKAGDLSKQVKDMVRDIITETAARCGVTFAEILRMIYDANAGIGAHFLGNRVNDERVRNMVRGIVAEIRAEQQV